MGPELIHKIKLANFSPELSLQLVKFCHIIFTKLSAIFR